MPLRLRHVALLLAILCGVPACSRAQAQPQDGLPLVDVQGISPGVPVPGPDAPGDVDLEQLDGLEHAALDMQVYEVIAQLQSLADARGDGIPALERDPVRITLYWFGPIPTTVADVIAANADVVPVEVVPTPYRYGDLLDEAHRLIQEYAPAFAAIGPRVTADGIDVTIATAAVEDAGGLDAALAAIDSPFPLFADAGDVVPVSAG